ncbi:hypothetical protein OH77DRAFT_949720 [Trametes cingulata]|nr:hypothetical protein OH77DRAFT_949720 [Trametes cingulata]
MVHDASCLVRRECQSRRFSNKHLKETNDRQNNIHMHSIAYDVWRERVMNDSMKPRLVGGDEDCQIDRSRRHRTPGTQMALCICLSTRSLYRDSARAVRCTSSVDNIRTLHAHFPHESAWAGWRSMRRPVLALSETCSRSLRGTDIYRWKARSCTLQHNVIVASEAIQSYLYNNHQANTIAPRRPPPRFPRCFRPPSDRASPGQQHRQRDRRRRTEKPDPSSKVPLQNGGAASKVTWRFLSKLAGSA